MFPKKCFKCNSKKIIVDEAGGKFECKKCGYKCDKNYLKNKIFVV